MSLQKAAPGVSKGKMLMAAMKAAKYVAGRIKITTGLYVISKSKSGAKMMKKVMLLKFLNCIEYLNLCFQIPQVFLLLKFDKSTAIYNTLGDILVDGQEFHWKSFPLAKPIQRFVVLLCGHDETNNCVLDLRSNIDFYAHESPAKYYCLMDHTVTNGKHSKL